MWINAYGSNIEGEEKAQYDRIKREDLLRRFDILMREVLYGLTIEDAKKLLESSAATIEKQCIGKIVPKEQIASDERVRYYQSTFV